MQIVIVIGIAIVVLIAIGLKMVISHINEELKHLLE